MILVIWKSYHEKLHEKNIKNKPRKGEKTRKEKNKKQTLIEKKNKLSTEKKY